MRQYLLRTFGLTALTLAFHASGFAQQNENDNENNPGVTSRKNDEIVVRHKNDKDTKFTVEIKNDKVFVNGVPIDENEYNDKDITVHRKKKVLYINGQTISITGPDELLDVAATTEPAVNFTETPSVNIAGLAELQNATVAAGTFAESPFHIVDGALTLSAGNPAWSGDSNKAFLGVSSVKDENAAGALVREVTKGSAAEKAGLRKGDLITQVDGTMIDGPEALSEAIGKYKPEDKVTLTFKRDDKENMIAVVLGGGSVMLYNKGAYNFNFTEPQKMEAMREMQSGPQAYSLYNSPRVFSLSAARPRLGIKAQDTEKGKGAKVLEVSNESAAEKAGIAQGDIITRFDGKEVNNATDLIELANASRDKNDIRVNVTREGKLLELEIKIPKKLKTADL